MSKPKQITIGHDDFFNHLSITSDIDILSKLSIKNGNTLFSKTSSVVASFHVIK